MQQAPDKCHNVRRPTTCRKVSVACRPHTPTSRHMLHNRGSAERSGARAARDTNIHTRALQAGTTQRLLLRYVHVPHSRPAVQCVLVILSQARASPHIAPDPRPAGRPSKLPQPRKTNCCCTCCVRTWPVRRPEPCLLSGLRHSPGDAAGAAGQQEAGTWVRCHSSAQSTVCRS